MAFYKLCAHSCTIPEEDDEWDCKVRPGYTFWQRLKVYLRNFLIVSSSSAYAQVYFNSPYLLRQERKRHLTNPQYLFVIHPFSLCRTIWNIYMIIVYMGILLLYPLIFQFIVHPSELYNNVVLVLDFSCKTEVMLKFYTGAINLETRQIYLNHIDIARRYIHGLLLIELLASINVNFYITFYKSCFEVTILILPKWFHISSIFRKMDYLTSATHGSNLFDLIKYSILSLLIVHWLACLLYTVPILVEYYINHYQTKELRTFYINGTYHYFTNGTTNQSMIEAQYVATQIVVKYLLNINFQLKNPKVEEMVMFTCILLFGQLFIIFLFVILIKAVLDIDTVQIKNQGILNELKEFMSHEHLPLAIQSRLYNYYEFRISKLVTDTRVTKLLSPELQMEIHINYCKRTLLQIELFSHFSEQVLKQIIANLEEEILMPNDVLIRAGNEFERLFIITKGTVAVYPSPSEIEVCHLEDGAVIGGLELITYSKALSTIIALEICEIWSLRRHVFMRCIERNPEAYNIISRNRNDKILIV